MTVRPATVKRPGVSASSGGRGPDQPVAGGRRGLGLEPVQTGEETLEPGSQILTPSFVEPDLDFADAGRHQLGLRSEGEVGLSTMSRSVIVSQQRTPRGVAGPHLLTGELTKCRHLQVTGSPDGVGLPAWPTFLPLIRVHYDRVALHHEDPRVGHRPE